MRDLMRLFRLMAQAQEEVLRSPYADLLLEMAVVRMATLAPVIDGDELARAVKALGGTPPASGGGPVSGPRPASMPPQPASSPAPARRLKIEGEVKADAPLRKSTRNEEPRPDTAADPGRSSSPDDSANGGGDLPDLRSYIRQKKAALAGFMELGAALELNGDILEVVPRNDIYVRYLNDNKGSIAALASEHYGRPIKVELGQPAPAAENSTPSPAQPETQEKAVAPTAAAPAPAAPQKGDFQSAMANAATAPEAGASNGEPIDRETARKELFADPMVRRILDELEGRLVDVRRPPVKRNEPQ